MRTICRTGKLRMPFGNIHPHVDVELDGRTVSLSISVQGKCDPDVKDMLCRLADEFNALISESLESQPATPG